MQFKKNAAFIRVCVAIPIPGLKAIFGVIMIAGIAFGPESGFLVGAVSALASNFFYSQGPYTPWQMMAYGAGGMLAGFLFYGKRLPRKPLVMGVFGFLGVLFFVGPITINFKNVMAIYLAGFPVNFSQAVGTFLVLSLLGKPMLEKLERIKIKYGMLRGMEKSA